MKKKYSLDFSIERDTDRCHAVKDILDTLDTDPSPTELEQMASYILYGKDENGQNAIQRNECTDKDKRYKSYKTKDDKVESYDEIMEKPTFNEQQVRPAYQRQAYTLPKPSIQHPRYDKAGNMIDPGDSDVPGMIEQWEIIDRWQHTLDVAQGKVPPQEGDNIITDPYRIFQLKHNLIDIRRHQYYLKDSDKPTLHFQNLDHPKPQFYDWSSDSFYWIPFKEWENRVQNSYTSRISTNIEDYETRGEGEQLEVKWVVCEHTFDWENTNHIRALMNHYNALYEQIHEKLNTYGVTLIWDFERYIKLAKFSPLRQYLIQQKISGISYDEILENLQIKYGIVYNKNHLSTILSREIPDRIAFVAKAQKLIAATPRNDCKYCRLCGRYLPRDPMFFSRDKSRIDKFAPYCKECSRQERIRKGVTAKDDLRKKDPTLS